MRGNVKEPMLNINAGRIVSVLPLRFWLDRDFREPLQQAIYTEALAMIEPERSFRIFWQAVERHQPRGATWDRIASEKRLDWEGATAE